MPNQVFISRYPTPDDLAEALGPPRPAPSSSPAEGSEALVLSVPTPLLGLITSEALKRNLAVADLVLQTLADVFEPSEPLRDPFE